MLKYKQISDLEDQMVSISETLSVGTLKTTVAKKLGKNASLLNIVVDITRMLEDDDDVTNYSSLEVLVNQESRSVPEKYKTNDACIVDGGLTDDPRVRMSCGHAITQDNLYAYCLSELKQMKTEIRCQTCNGSWDFDDIIERGDLNLDEKIFFSRKFQMNFISSNSDVKQCPRCKSFGTRTNTGNNRVVCTFCSKERKNPFEFCWECNNLWVNNHVCPNKLEEIQQRLTNCERVTMTCSKITNVPKIRMCPCCYMLLEHAGGCKTMTCICKYVFCFSCLKSKDGKGLGCNSLSQKCEVAPIQRVLPP